MAENVSITLNTDNIDGIISAVHDYAAKSAAETAQELATSYAETAPRQTGFMASSAYVVTKDSSTYGQGVSGDGPLLPPVAPPTSDTEAIMAVAAAYAAYPEFGTKDEAAQPAFHPAFDKASTFLSNVLSDIKKALGSFEE